MLNNNASPPQQQQPSYYGGAPPPAAPSLQSRPPAPRQQQLHQSTVAYNNSPYPSNNVQQPVYHQQQQQQSYGYPASSESGFMQQQPMQQPQQQPYGFANDQTGFQGAMDSNGGQPMDTNTPTTFTPNPYATKQLNDEDEPPLLEELGVNIEHIILKTKAVVIPFRRFQKSSALADPALIMEDADLAGPLVLALLLGGELMMTGKLQFGYIYGFGVFGCLAMTLIMNLMSPEKAISFWTVASVLGYALLPVNILAALKILFWGYFTEIFALITVLWSTTASTRLLEVGCGMGAQRYLLAYPIALLYSAFVLITIF